ncbi:prefoldin subunit alpha [Candidatus Woesearchaeota archaeon]|nr:prefoldin subunit alpha [Candidatus Woesearchaeota archaeon]
MSEEKLQSMYMEYQMISNSIKQLEQQNVSLDNQLMELAHTSQGLDDMKHVKKGNEILVPVSPGIYAKAELKEEDKFIVNVGAEIAVHKNIEDTKKIIDTQIGEIGNLKEKISMELQKNAEKASSMETEMNRMASALKK